MVFIFPYHQPPDDDYDCEWYPEIPNWLHYIIMTILYGLLLVELYWGYTIISSF